MAKVLIRRKKKVFVKDLNREVVVSKPRYYYIDDDKKDFHSREGIIAKKDLKKKDGSRIKTDQKKEFSIFSSTFIDDFKRIKRLPQIIPLKDIGFIIAETGVGKKSRVVDAGTGSGALSCFLASHVKEVVTYDIEKEHCKIARKNIKSLGLNNIKVRNKNIYKGIEEKDVDLVVLDLPEPWNGIGAAENALKPGGFLVSYSPSVPQVTDFVNTVTKNDKFVVLKTVEIIERRWDVDGRKVRPKSGGIGHSGFITVVRRI